MVAFYYARARGHEKGIYVNLDHVLTATPTDAHGVSLKMVDGAIILLEGIEAEEFIAALSDDEPDDDDLE